MLARYQAAGIAVVASPARGAWRWHSDAWPADAVCERDLERRYRRDRDRAMAGLAGPRQPEDSPAVGGLPPF